MKATLYLTQDVRECGVQFRHAVFNIFSHNRDDHSKIFSFVMDSKGIWKVSPAYDLIFSSGPSGEHTIMIMGEGKNPKCELLLKLANIAGLDKQIALETIEQVSNAVAKWEQFADEVGLSALQTKTIGNVLRRIRKGF